MVIASRAHASHFLAEDWKKSQLQNFSAPGSNCRFAPAISKNTA
jgi:hypothetical protein